MAAGLGFKTFTTGEVLTAADVNGYLMQGILVFATEAARNSAITSPQEGQFAFTKDTNSLWYYTGSAWVASGATGDIEGVTAGTGISGGGTSGTVTITNSMATEITAKADLIVGTGNAAFDNLPVGANGTVLTADSTVSPTGLKWAALPSAAPASASATVATNDAIASATYGDLPSAGPAVTITTGTKALVIVTAYLENDGAGSAFMGYAVSGATTIAATDTTALVKAGSGSYRMSAVSRLSTLTAGSNTFTAKYRRTGSGTYGYYTDREICVIDLGS